MKLSKMFIVVIAVLVAAGTAFITPALAQCGSGAMQDCSGGDGTPNGTNGSNGTPGSVGLGGMVGQDGGAGDVGGAGGNGANGAAGTAETEIISSPVSLVNIDTSGGSGADGGTGGIGGVGGAGGLGFTTDGSIPGANGGAGGTGGEGGNGGTGGAGGDLSLTFAAAISGDVILYTGGGSGGDGGNAGDGGTGGIGGARITAGFGGNGGAGDNGGLGGNGGNAGDAGDIALVVNAQVSGFISANAAGGQAGDGGDGGAGGNGGDGGNGPYGIGNPGIPGRDGSDGRGGNAGEGGNITIDVNAQVGTGINTTTSGSVNVHLNNGAQVGGTMNGDTDNQTTNATLTFSMTATQAESDALDALAAAGGSISIGGQTYTWTNFDQIINLLVINGVPNQPPRANDDDEDSQTSAAPVCLLVDGAANGVVRATVPAGTVTDGSVFCRIINENGAFVQNPAELGTTALLNAGVLQAVDVFGLKRDGFPAAAFNNPVEICLQGSGSLYYLDATQSPRSLQALNTRQSGGFACGSIPNAGTVVLTQPAGDAAPQAAAPVVSAETALSGCRVTTLNMMNLRAAPSLDSAVISKIPFDTTYDATARTAGWFRIVVGNGQGWVSADLVRTTGSCG